MISAATLLLAVFLGRPLLEWLIVKSVPVQSLRPFVGRTGALSLWAERLLETKLLAIVHEERVQSEKREQNILNELAAASNLPAWAGQYLDPADHETTLLLSPKSGYLRRTVNDFEHGAIAASNPENLLLECRIARRLGLSDQDALIPVRWGERNLLIRQASMLSFCSFVNGGPFRANLLFVKHEDLNKPCGPRPDVPGEFAGLLRPLPTAAILATSGVIESIEEDELIGAPLIRYQFHCLLDRGSADGFCVGQSLRALFGDFDSCDIIAIRANYCTLRCEGLFLEGTPQAEYLPLPGWIFGLLDNSDTGDPNGLRITDSNAERIPIRKSRSS